MAGSIKTHIIAGLSGAVLTMYFAHASKQRAVAEATEVADSYRNLAWMDGGLLKIANEQATALIACNDLLLDSKTISDDLLKSFLTCQTQAVSAAMQKNEKVVVTHHHMENRSPK